MNYIFESIFVGIYTSLIYLVFSPFIKNFYILLLICGFFKHFLGSLFGIWTWYCNNGYACSKILKNKKYKANRLNIICESIYEAFLFLTFGFILNLIFNKFGNIYENSKLKYMYLFFILGFLLHILGEHTEIHKQFCLNKCY